MYTCFVFAGKPGLVLLIGGVFLLEYLVMRVAQRKFPAAWSWPLLAAGLAWLMAAVWELYAAEEGSSMRLDVFTVYPLLLTVSGVGLLLSIGSLAAGLLPRKPAKAAEPPQEVRTARIDYYPCGNRDDYETLVRTGLIGGREDRREPGGGWN